MARKAAAKQADTESAGEKPADGGQASDGRARAQAQAQARTARTAGKPARAGAGAKKDPAASSTSGAPATGGSGGTSSGMRIGYARVSTLDQNPALQQDALRAADCIKVFEDRASGAKASAERPGLAAALEYARPGDTLVVWRLDRLGRSLRDLIDRVQELEARGIGFKSLREGFDTTSSGGRLVFHVFGALAEFERALIRERTSAGLAAARARGRKGGRKKALSPAQVEQMRVLARDPNITVGEICDTFGVSRNTFYRHVHERQHGQ